MVGNGKTDGAGPTPVGPVAPPSLGEVYEISARRQRTRYRFIQGTLIAVAIAGVGVGIRSQGGGDTTELTQQPAGEVENELAEPLTDEPMVGDSEQCLFVDGTTEFVGLTPWMEDGREAYFANPLVDVQEIEDLTSFWQIPFDETKALVGLAGQRGLVLAPTTSDAALNAWHAEGYTGEQLADIAEEWNVTTVSVKVLRLIGDSSIETALEECGLTTPG